MKADALCVIVLNTDALLLVEATLQKLSTSEDLGILAESLRGCDATQWLSSWPVCGTRGFITVFTTGSHRLLSQAISVHVRFDVFTAVTMKNGVWDVTP
jgi:hypothetical protein